MDGARYAARSLKEKHGDSSPFSHSGVNNSSHAEDVIRDGGWPADEVYEILDAVSVTSSNWRGRRRYRLVVDDEGYEGSVAARPPRHDGDASKSSRRVNSC